MRIKVSKYLYYFCILISFSIYYPSSLKAQVTIGSHNEPVAGALLDLKQDDPNGLSSMGLGMPRVNLESPNSLQPCADETIGTNAIDHTGLVVYAVKQFGVAEINCPGLYVWNGQKWVSLYPSKKDAGFDYISDKEGNQYKIHTFGSAGTWMIENLRSTKTICGEDLVDKASISTSAKYFAYPAQVGTSYTPGQPPLWKKEYGLLYNWFAATDNANQASENQGGTIHETIQGICPKGWHLPSDVEWTELTQEIRQHPDLYSSMPAMPLLTNSTVGEAMKSPTLVNESNLTLVNAQSNTDGTGFNALMVGRVWNGLTRNYSGETSFWSSSKGDPTPGGHETAYSRTLRANKDVGSGTSEEKATEVVRFPNSAYCLYSIRCKKNN